MRRVIDIHTHAFPEKVEQKAVQFLENHYKISIPNKGTLEELVKSADNAGVEKIVVHATATNAAQVHNINTWIASISNEKIIGFGTIHPDFADYKAELDRMEELGLKGIKLHPDFQEFDIDDRRMWPIYEAIGTRFPMLIHSGDVNLEYSRPRKLARVLEQFPQLRVTAAHMGGYSRWDEVWDCLVGKNVWFDTSSCWWKLNMAEMVQMIREHGADKILFGTDYPIVDHTGELERFMQLPLTEDEREMILWKNALNFLGISDSI